MSRRIAVIGLGRMGRAVARFLSRRGCYVLGVDRDEEAVREVAVEVSKAVVIDATDRLALTRAGVGECDGAVVTIGKRIEASVMTTLLLARHLEIKEIHARAVSDNHAEILTAVGATTVVQLELEMGRRIAQHIVMPQFRDVFSITGALALVETEPLPEMVGKTLKELEFKARYGAYCMALRRGHAGQPGVLGGELTEDARSIVNLPDADERIEADDVLVLLGLEERLAEGFSGRGN